MKLKLLASFVLIICLSICSFSRLDLKVCYPKFDAHKTKNLLQASNISSFDIKIDNKTPYEELITKEIDIHGIAKDYMLSTFIPIYVDLEDVNEKMGIECQRKTEKGALYSIHKVKQGGLFYMFFDEDFQNLEKSSLLECFYVEKSLSYDDFSDIKAGSSFSDIAIIDPTIQIVKNLYDSAFEDINQLNYYYTILYLTDGHLSIFFEPNNKNGCVSGMIFDETYTIAGGRSGRGPDINGEILPRDLF